MKERKRVPFYETPCNRAYARVMAVLIIFLVILQTLINLLLLSSVFSLNLT